jgi:hypothetical protein
MRLMGLKKSFFEEYRIEIFLFLSALFIRLPFFFRDYIDQDESTFILMGQSIADGHLPYDYLWDLKPPLLFYFFALIEKTFPHSFIAIRFTGVLIVFLSGLLLIRITRKAGLKNGFLIALGYIILSSEFGSLQGVMSEHFAVFFLLLAFDFLLREQKHFNFLITGLLLGCAVLCKLNYAYAIAALLIFYFISELKKEDITKTFVAATLVLSGILVSIFLTAFPFIVSGKIHLFINSVFLAPLEYSRATNYTSFEKFKTTWWIILLIVIVCFFAIRASNEENKRFVWKLIAILVGTVYTFYSSGIINGHYLVQLYAFLLMILFGVIFRKNMQLKLGLAAAIVLLLSFESIWEYYRIASNLKHFAEYRPTFEIVRELKKRNLQNDKIFFADYHIGYWLVDQYPLTKSTTHPSNIARPYLFKYFNDSSKSSLEDLQFIMEKIRPDVIVSKYNKLNFFADSSAENLFFKENLSQNFGEVYKDSIDKIFIWKRKND